jgi:macrodomain Ter protein organizer (MatP/YcbG family)
MNLAIRDHKIYQMKAELENRKKMLCTKRKQLVNSERENTFLKDITDDYDRYNKHIISQKEQQIAFLNTLNQYIDNVTKDLHLTDTKLKESRQEQREITKEMTYLKNELDDLVEKNTTI